MLLLRVALLFLLLIYSLGGFANVGIHTCHQLFDLIIEKSVEVDKFDNAVEMELYFNEESVADTILSLLTTEDGTVRPLLKAVYAGRRVDIKPPSWLSKYSMDPYSVRWDDLTVHEKIDLVNYLSKKRGVDFFQDRRIAGLVVKGSVDLLIPNVMELFGRVYQSGIATINLSEIFGVVEYASPKMLDSFSGVELHLRESGVRAGKLSNDAWKFLDLVKIPRASQHIHIVAKLPLSSLYQNPDIVAVALSDYYRKANLLAEMYGIVETHSPITLKSNGSPLWDLVTTFSSLNNEKADSVTRFFQSVGHKRSRPKIGDDLKLSWIGFRGDDFYENPDRFGFEFRSLSSFDNPQHYNLILNAIQEGMVADPLSHETEVIKWTTYLKEHSLVSRTDQLVGARHYNQLDDIAQLNKLPDEFNELISGASWNRLMKWAKRDRSIKMVLFDWEHDSLLYNNEIVKKSIKQSQLTAFKEILRIVLLSEGVSERAITVELNKIVSKFLVESGLYERVLADFKLTSKMFH